MTLTAPQFKIQSADDKKIQSADDAVEHVLAALPAAAQAAAAAQGRPAPSPQAHDAQELSP